MIKKNINFLKIKKKQIRFILIFSILLLAIASTFGLAYYLSGKNSTEDPATNNSTEPSAVDDAFYLNVKKIGVSAPIITGVDPNNIEEYNKRLQEGVLHMSGTAFPGEVGNIFIYGHSSALDPSKYDKIFADLDNLATGDQIEINYKRDKYTYNVSEKKIVDSTDLSVLKQTDSQILTLMTCWPIGTDDKRLVVIAERAE